jgi:hypothetical protein
MFDALRLSGPSVFSPTGGRDWLFDSAEALGAPTWWAAAISYACPQWHSDQWLSAAVRLADATDLAVGLRFRTTRPPFHALAATDGFAPTHSGWQPLVLMRQFLHNPSRGTLADYLQLLAETGHLARLLPFFNGSSGCGQLIQHEIHELSR